MAKIKAILCLDIDGTLTDHEMKMHPNDVKVIHDFPNSIQPVFATGRHLRSAKAILAENKVFEDMAIPFPSIFMNGGASYLPEEQLLTQHTFSPDILKALIDLSKSFPGTTFGFFTITATFLINPTHFGHHVSDIHYLSSEDVNEETLPDGIVKMMVMEKDKEKLKKVEQRGAKIEAEMAYSLPYLIEFTPSGVTKAVGLPPLIEALSLNNLPIFTAGDGQNDLGLFNIAEKSFAPTYAHPKILESADHIIDREKKGMLNPIIEIISKQF